MLSPPLILVILCSLSLSFARHASEFSFSSSLIPLYVQNQLKNPCAEISLASSRILAPADPRIILITQSFPLATCTIGNDTQSNFNGFHIDLFVAIGNELGWTQGVDYAFSCVTQDEMYTRVLANDNVTCAEGGIAISADKLRTGYKFSQPLSQGGLSILIRRTDPRTIWSFLLPISLKGGLSLIFATFVCGVFIWFFEERNWKRPIKEHITNFGEVMYDVFSSYYETNALELQRLPSRVLQWVFWLVVVIFLSIYQADLTEKLSSTYVQKEFRTFQDAVAEGKNFGTAEVFMPLIKTNIPSVPNINYYTGDTLENTVQTMIEDLRNKKIDAIILTNPLTEYYGTQYCDVQELDDYIGDFDYGLMFPPAADRQLVTNISQAIIKLSETYRIQLLKNQNLRETPNAECDSGESISVKELGGLWVILGVAILVSVIIHLLRKAKVIKPLENYKPPYYTYFSQKTEIFESQLKEAVQFEMNKILMTYKDQLLEEVEDFENTLLLQPKKPETEKNEGQL